MTAKTTYEISSENLPPVDDAASSAAALREKLTDALTPGYQAEFDPEEAAVVGAFREVALSEADAAGSSDDLADSLEEPAFLDEEGPGAEIPPFITTTNTHELYDIRPGETVSEAIARRNAKGSDRCH